MKRKLLAGLLTFCLLTEALPISAFSSCLHEHADHCYQQVLDCSHEHTDHCYPQDEEAPTACSHEHTDHCYRQELVCPHKHTLECFPGGENKPNSDLDGDGTEPTPGTPESPNTPEIPGPTEPAPPLAGEENTAVHTHTSDCYQQVTACLHVHTPECYPDKSPAAEPAPAAEPSQSDADKTGQGDADKPSQGDTDEPGQGDADKPDQGNTDEPGQGDADKPGQGDADEPSQGDADKPGQGDADKPGQGDTDEPGHGDADEPGQGDADEPIEGDADKPQPTQCSHACTEENGCITTVLVCPYADAVFLTGWNWVDEEAILLQQDGQWFLPLPSASESQPVKQEELISLLPAEVRAALPNGGEELLQLQWSLSTLPKDGAWEGSYILPAALPEGYILSEGVPQPQVTLLLGGAQVQAANYPARKFELFGSKAELEAALDNHVVEGLNPPNTVVNLFDYASTFSGAHNNPQFKIDLLPRTIIVPEGNNSTAAGENDWNAGINQNRLLLFGDMMVGAGYWNIGAGAGRDWAKRNTNMQGIVERRLGEDGYPVISKENVRSLLPDEQNGNELVNIWRAEDTNNTTIEPGRAHALSQRVLENAGAEYDYDTGIFNLDNVNFSLDYLFNEKDTSAYTNPGGDNTSYCWRRSKRFYQNVTNLFQINNEGYYYYNARENFAEFVEDPNNTTKDGLPSAGYIKLYDGPAVWRTDGGWNSATNSFDGEKSLGNFFPFNKATEVFDGLETTNEGSQILSSSGSNDSIDGRGLDNAYWSTAVNYLDRKPLKNSATREDVFINHHMGMTVEIDFAQPVDGMLNMGETGKQPMIFEFSGDDDVWIFIDDVLVLDIGGIHSELYGTIDFSTGDVVVGQSWRTGGKIPEDPTKDPAPTVKTTLRDQFIAALGEDEAKNMAWNGNTFASSSTHTLKMFYLERGNYDSSLYLRFNLQQPFYHQVKKVDQDGNPLNDVAFNLYAAKLRDGITEISGNADDYEKVNNTVLATLTTAKDGTDTFVEKDGSGNLRPFNFADRYAVDGTEYYILEEATAPKGYRKLPKDIILHYNNNLVMLTVANRYQTGAYSSIFSNIVEGGQLTYGAFDTVTGDIKPNKDKKPTDESEQEGLVIAVPMQLQRNMNFAEATGKWGALYGSTLTGYNIIIPESRTAAAWRDAVLKAALYQCSNDAWPYWYLDYNLDNRRLEGTLKDLPGQADRYELMGGDNVDMKMTYGIIEPYALEKLGITGATSAERYQALSNYVQKEIAAASAKKPNSKTEEVAKEVISRISEVLRTATPPGNDYKPDGEPSQRGFSFLNTNQFQRDFRSIIYVPNERRELQVWKVDEDGRSVNGATFTLFEGIKDNANNLVKGKAVATGVTATVNGRDGVLIFTPAPVTDNGKPDGKPMPGYARMDWVDYTGEAKAPCYILQETQAPAGYTCNDTEIPVVLGHYSLYVDAGTPEDGVTVMAGVGKLMQTMVKYAADDQVDITLRDITAIAQTQPNMSSWALDGWQDDLIEDTGGLRVPRSMNLHYGLNAQIDYGLHDEDGGKTMYPFFTTNTGFLRTRIVQNVAALENPQYEGFHNVANWDNLGNTDITGLFRQVNIAVVTDKNTPEHHNGSLTISKRITGDGLTLEDYTKNFTFTVLLKDKDGAALPGEYYYYGSNRAGTIADGGTLTLRHKESVTILGLPPETRWSVSETVPQGWYAEPNHGVINGIISADKTELAGFTNTKGERDSSGSLTVHKIVTGNRGDTNRSFPFKVTLADSTIQGQYGEMEFINGVATFQLRHDESKTAQGLPDGLRYTVEETNSAGHTVTSTGETGTILEGQTVTAIFKNYRGGGGDHEDDDYTSLTVKKVWALNNGGTPAGSIEVELLRDGRHYTTITLSDENNWTYTWKHLDDWYHWTVAEVEVPEGFTSHITHNGQVWTITNSDSPKSDTPKTPGNPNNPNTGDLSRTRFWMSLCLYTLGGCLLLLWLKPKWNKLQSKKQDKNL